MIAVRVPRVSVKSQVTGPRAWDSYWAGREHTISFLAGAGRSPVHAPFTAPGD